jgi:DNA-binding MarR family transcriptional regulator
MTAATDAQADESPVEVEALDIGYLALFVGLAFGQRVQEQLAARGFGDLRFSHGYLFQHLVAGERTIGELAERLEVTQQAASKSVAELEALGYVERTTDAGDARVRRVRLSERGQSAVAHSRRLRAQLESRLARTFVRKHGARAVSRTRALLAQALGALGGLEAVRARRVVVPR